MSTSNYEFKGIAVRGVFGVALTSIETEASLESDENEPLVADVALLGAEDWFNHLCELQDSLSPEQYRNKGDYIFKAQFREESGITEYSNVEVVQK